MPFVFPIIFLGVHKKIPNCMTAQKTYFSDEGLSDGLVLKARVCEIIIVVIRWRPITMVTRAAWRA